MENAPNELEPTKWILFIGIHRISFKREIASILYDIMNAGKRTKNRPPKTFVL